MKTKKIITVLLLILTILFSMQNLIYAQAEISRAEIFVIEPYELHLQYWYSGGYWMYTANDYTGYTYNGVTYPAYCLDPLLDGVGDAGNYTVDIQGALSDVRIWRVIINGFPYKTAEQLGVENNLDAYVATQHAIYSVMFDFDVRGHYNAPDIRAGKIINAIERLTNEGRYGSATPENANVRINKQGEFIEEQDCYTQQYSVSSTVGIASYTVTNTAGYTVNKNGETFKVIIPKDLLTEDINATITVKAECKVYPVFYRTFSK